MGRRNHCENPRGERETRYVKASKASKKKCGKGTIKDPYTSLAEAEADKKWTTLIVLYSSEALDGGINMRPNTKLIGKVSRCGKKPIITNTTQDIDPENPDYTIGNGVYITKGKVIIKNILFKNTQKSAIRYSEAIQTTDLYVSHVEIVGQNQSNTIVDVKDLVNIFYFSEVGAYPLSGIEGITKAPGITKLYDVYIHDNYTGPAVNSGVYNNSNRKLVIDKCNFSDLTNRTLGDIQPINGSVSVSFRSSRLTSDTEPLLFGWVLSEDGLINYGIYTGDVTSSGEYILLFGFAFESTDGEVPLFVQDNPEIQNIASGIQLGSFESSKQDVFIHDTFIGNFKISKTDFGFPMSAVPFSDLSIGNAAISNFSTFGSSCKLKIDKSSLKNVTDPVAAARGFIASQKMLMIGNSSSLDKPSGGRNTISLDFSESQFVEDTPVTFESNDLIFRMLMDNTNLKYNLIGNKFKGHIQGMETILVNVAEDLGLPPISSNLCATFKNNTFENQITLLIMVIESFGSATKLKVKFENNIITSDFGNVFTLVNTRAGPIEGLEGSIKLRNNEVFSTNQDLPFSNKTVFDSISVGGPTTSSNVSVEAKYNNFIGHGLAVFDADVTSFNKSSGNVPEWKLGSNFWSKPDPKIDVDEGQANFNPIFNFKVPICK